MSDRPLWVPSPDRVASARLTAFRHHLAQTSGAVLPDYGTLHRFSVDRPDVFWSAVWEFCGVIGDRGTIAVDHPDRMPGARFFPDARLNFAENLLRDADDRPAIVFSGENRVRRTLTRRELYEEVSRVAAAFTRLGVRAGDRIAAYVPNLSEAVAGMLAAAALGAIWSSASPDFGVPGVLDRFGQIAPKVLISADGYFYGGKVHDSLSKLAEIAQDIPSIEHVVVVPFVSRDPDLSAVPRAISWTSMCNRETAGPVPFARLPFNHPVYILYSSGTTGIPKCIVHGAGGTLLQHLKEHQLHCDIKRDDRVFYFTTCGWMMWNWLVSALASNATLLLYDGSPLFPSPSALFDFADESGMTLFGTSAKYLAGMEKAGVRPRASHSLASVRTITSTGSPLAPESFDYVYRDVKADVHLASISGGTDIVSCFVGGDPTGPVWRGEIQARGLGMDVDVFDDDGHSVVETQGELVCKRPFPSMPLEFWNDPDGRRYRAAYFDRFPGVWCHGDWALVTKHGGIVILGRSDAVLNPGGVRIGTAEIYRQVEQLDEVVEALVVGQRWEQDERIVLFVKLRDGLTLDAALTRRIQDHIRHQTTPRHVPSRIVQVADIPRTKSGKIVELAVRDIIHGRPVKNVEALANPEALDQFRDRRELRS